ncbi:hypothetical protein TNCV_2255121 [Trichonephila clavipes]|nr:hypothetical protein TNCV_2255121 [Trichonephila clavipes]
MLRRLVGTTAPGHHDCSNSGMKNLSNHGSIPITIDCNVVAFIVFEEGFHQPIKRTKQPLRRQLTFLKVPVPQWVVYLVGLLPTEVSNLITKESFADAQDYYKVKQILLKRFKLSAEKFRQMFSRHTKIL